MDRTLPLLIPRIMVRAHTAAAVVSRRPQSSAGRRADRIGHNRLMRLIHELEAEHELIDQVVGSFLGFATRVGCGDADLSAGAAYIRFFRLYAGDFHHAREEGVLFPALVEQVNLPADRGPIAVLTAEHRRMSAVLGQIESLLEGGLHEDGSCGRLKAFATEYGYALWHHIDAENSVLLPEAAERLRKRSVPELPTRAMTEAESDARRAGEELVRCYPPISDRDVIRGDGCVLCSAFADTCRGLEAEWWTESEWEELDDHLSS